LRFQKDEWSKLLADSTRSRSTMTFVDRSGQKRSPESLHARLVKMQSQSIAIGGAIGARQYFPDLDLVGVPRLDISVHSPGNWVNLEFVRRLDPALQLAERTGEPPNLVIHFIRRNESLFYKDKKGGLWADPVECLLDLSEARLESQALQFLEHYTSEKGAGQ